LEAPRADIKLYERITRQTYLVIGALIGFQAFLLFADWASSDLYWRHRKTVERPVFGSENSQHPTDWYIPTHLIHVIILYLLLWLIVPRVPIALRFIVAVTLEDGREVIENTR
jgi:hypothetical protein